MKDIDPGVGLVLLYYTVKASLPKKIQLSDEHTEYIWVKSLDDLKVSDKDSENVKIIEKILK